MKLMRVGIDLAKEVFQVHGVDRNEKAVLKKKLKREVFLKYFAEEVELGCEIGMEACGGAHHWARELQKLGFIVKLMAPQHVKPYVKTNKNDLRDAEAICEAMSRPSMRFVAIKSVEQQEVLMLHRIRDGLIGQRTAKANQIRGLVAEFGIVAPKGLDVLRARLAEWVEEKEQGLRVEGRRLLQGLWQDLQEQDRRIDELDKQINIVVRQSKAAQRLMTIPGIGPITATALVATVGDAKQFKSGREMAAWLGMTPGQHSSGGKERLLGISKRGDSYLRTLLVHGARAVVRTSVKKTDRQSIWLNQMAQRRHSNVVVVAMAHKNARIAWAVLSKESEYEPNFAAH